MGLHAHGAPGQRVQPGDGDEDLRRERQDLFLPRHLQGGGGEGIDISAVWTNIVREGYFW